MALRVMSFNVHHGVGVDGRLDLARTAAVIAASGAEVVGLQEVDRHLSDRSGRVDQAGWLGAHLGMHVAYGATIDRDPDDPTDRAAPRRRYGNAVLSRHPVLGRRVVPLPADAGAEPRGLLEVLVSVDGTDVRVATTHLQNRSARQRRAQAAAIVAALGTDPRPTVLVGDMNAEPDSPEVGLLTAVFDDAWAAVGAGDGWTFDAATPHARIDYVLSTPDVVARAARVVPSGASDHLPVVADLHLPGAT